MGGLDFGTHLCLLGFRFLFLDRCYSHWTLESFCFLSPYFHVKTLHLLYFVPKVSLSVRMELSGLLGRNCVEFRFYLYFHYLEVTVKLMCMSL